ncbi:hypothetical protein Q8A73_006544 [Channa argus]|nr:hypothetical protein Q8A73_006544 [Channa argus]
MENNPLHEENMRFIDPLIRERNWRIQLSRELEHTKEQLARQKNLKEMYINREKDLKRNLERMEKYVCLETISAAKIATQVLVNTKHRKKKLLQKDYEELQVAHRISQEKFTAELESQRYENKALTEELVKIRDAYDELSVQHNTAVLSAKQQGDTLQKEFAKERKTFTDRVANDAFLIQNMRAEMDMFLQKNAEEIRVLQLNAAHKEVLIQKECDELKSQLGVQMSLNRAQTISQERLTAELQLEKAKNKDLKRELDKVKAAYDDVSVQYNTLVSTGKQQADALKREFADRVANDSPVIQNVEDGMDTLRQKTTDELKNLLINAADKEMLSGGENSAQRPNVTRPGAQS